MLNNEDLCYRNENSVWSSIRTLNFRVLGWRGLAVNWDDGSTKHIQYATSDKMYEEVWFPKDQPINTQKLGTWEMAQRLRASALAKDPSPAYKYSRSSNGSGLLGATQKCARTHRGAGVRASEHWFSEGTMVALPTVLVKIHSMILKSAVTGS